jgi:endonuclease/exonuclease/phosphatase family metal-dependent hydrolase
MALARILALITALLLIPVATADAAKPAPVKVMTRNLYLGADLGPGMNATSLQGLVDGAGQILNQVDANKPAIRMHGVANEILAAKPDLVGLQEAALWRTEPCDKNPLPPAATDVRYDYIQEIMSHLKGQYRVAVVKPEFDFEVWANTDGNEQTAGPNCPMGSEINGRLTMRDAILVRKGVKVSSPTSGTFDELREVTPAGVKVDVTRGWASVDATVSGHKFHFVDTHTEAFDNSQTNTTNKGTSVGNGQVREEQAKELVAKGGPATSKLPVILVGDMNSDVKTEVKPGDALAYRALLDAKFVERSTSKNGCCLNADILTDGSPKDYNHRVDHVITDAPKKVTLVSSALTGTKQAGGFWDSDHQGLVSTLKMS